MKATIKIFCPECAEQIKTSPWAHWTNKHKRILQAAKKEEK